MHPVIRLLRYIPYNLIMNQIISGRWCPATGTLSSVPPNVNFIPANFAVPPPILENENCVNSQCPEFYAEDALMLSQVIYLGLLWSATTVFPVYTQFNASCEKAELYVSSGPSTGGFSDSQYGAPQDQAQPAPVPHFGEWTTVAPFNPIQPVLDNSFQSEQALPNPGTLIPQAHQKRQIITNEVIEEILTLKQNVVNFTKIAYWLQFTEAVIKREFWVLLKRDVQSWARSQRSNLTLRLRRCIPSCLTFCNMAYDCAISATLTRCLSSILDNVIFISYYKFSLQFHDYGTLSEKNSPKGKRKETKGM
ncbi:hypothetical protein DSO57_1015044 [Entomophthora muscae]|uniref:Uncharacterized protein n=1 Tax=Entomophthora muscae TaxID=34485 RepID=A0ACC2TSN4_9FUNG|nr:hypothetical protein DSO57_1015044 [Entomophthora muscae]